MPTKIAAPPFEGFPLEAHRFLADLAVRRVPCDLRAITGAAGPRVLGKVSLP